MWNIPRLWEGGQCIIIGGGSSIPHQFGVPKEIIQAVYAGKLTPEAYSPYMSGIHDQHIIAVNVAYKIGPWIDCVLFGDDNFLKGREMDFLTFPGLKITCAKQVTEYPHQLKIIGRDNLKPYGISVKPGMVSWNHNTGAAAINLAVQFGVKRIILLGFDMKLDADNNQHWHKFYSTPLKNIEHTMTAHLKGFPIIARELAGIVEVINANPDSGIDCFPKRNIKDLF